MPPSSRILNDPERHRLMAGDHEALVLPSYGMLCGSLRHRGEEILGRVADLDNAAAKGSTAGIPLLYPWANRLAGMRYRAAEREVTLGADSPLLHFDGNGLPIHGVPWVLLRWNVLDATREHIIAELDWNRPDLLNVFPFRHTVRMSVGLDAGALAIDVSVLANQGDAVPVCFGFHPYFSCAGVPREEWRLSMPKMRRLATDARGIPTGVESARPASAEPLGDLEYDDGFALDGERATFTIAGGDRSIAIDFERGFRFAQVFAPRSKELIAIEPMTAPTNALVSGQRLHIINAGDQFEAAFRVRSPIAG